MTSFVALYRGRTIHEAQVVALSTDPRLVQQVAATLLVEVPTTGDAILDSLESGRKKALRQVAGKARLKAPRQARTASTPTPRSKNDPGESCSTVTGPTGSSLTDTAHKGGETAHDANPGS